MDEVHIHEGLVKLSDYLISDTHSYLSVTICMMGFIMNVITMVVLMQKSMRTPTNLLLASISVADMITILMYAPKLIVGTEFPLISKSKAFAYYKLVFAHVSLLSHTVSVWLTVSLCLFRCMIMISQKGKRYTGTMHTVIAMVIVIIGTTLLVLPNFILLRVNTTYIKQGTEYNRNLGNQQTSNGTNHYIESDTATSAGIPIYETVQVWYIDIGDRNATIEENQRAEKLYQIQMWIVAVPCKILPCLLLVIMSGLLIHKLHQIQSRFKKMTSGQNRAKATDGRNSQPSSPLLKKKSLNYEGSRIKKNLLKLPATTANNSEHTTSRHNSAVSLSVAQDSEVPHKTKSSTKRQKSQTRGQQTHRATLMLLVVVITFVIAEFPIALLLLLSQVLGPTFFDHVYLRVAKIFDLLIIVNCSVNFVIYCSMSAQFRETFAEFFCHSALLNYCCKLKNRLHAKRTSLSQQHHVGKRFTQVQQDLDPTVMDTSVYEAD